MKRVISVLATLSLVAASLFAAVGTAQAAPEILDEAPLAVHEAASWDVAYDKDGYLYVATGNANGVLVYEPSAPTGAPPVRQLKADEGVNNPWSLDVDSTGRLYVHSTSGGDRIGVYEPRAGAGSEPFKILQPELASDYNLQSVGGIALDSSDNLYVTKTDAPGSRNVVMRWDSEWLNDSADIVTSAPDRELIGDSTLLDDPLGIDFDASDKMYISNMASGQVTQYANDWDAQDTAPERTLTTPWASILRLGVDAAGTVFQANGRKLVGKFAAGWDSGEIEPTAIYEGELTGLFRTRAVAWDPTTGNIAVGDAGDNNAEPAGPATVRVFKGDPIPGPDPTPTPTPDPTPNPTPTPPVKKLQKPAKSCANTSLKKIKKKGFTKLAGANCKTNAGKLVGVKVSKKSASSRGEVGPTKWRLVCKRGSKLTTPKKKSQGFYCTKSKGPLSIQTVGQKINLGVTWAAPGSAKFKAFKQSKVFKVK